jgi:hypothetical protein
LVPRIGWALHFALWRATVLVVVSSLETINMSDCTRSNILEVGGMSSWSSFRQKVSAKVESARKTRALKVSQRSFPSSVLTPLLVRAVLQWWQNAPVVAAVIGSRPIFRSTWVGLV